MTEKYSSPDIDDNHPVQCGNCEWRGTGKQLKPVENLFMRVDPGEPMPAGECPECGSLAHIVEPDSPYPDGDYRNKDRSP